MNLKRSGTDDMSADSGLVDFLRARLNEDEREAKAAHRKHGPHWRSDGEYLNILDTGGDRSISVNPWGATSGPLGPHIARHDPARVLREVEAKRRTIDRYAENPGEPWPLFPLLEMATVYADHLDYREEWRPRLAL